jgi:trehalose 6-phosphate synthase/phosphatase
MKRLIIISNRLPVNITKKNKVVIISAKTRKFLEIHFPHSGLILAAEHGTFIRNELEWKDNIIPGDGHGNRKLTEYMKSITERTPGSYLEIREASVAWHYAKTDLWLADLRSRQLYDMLINPVTRLNLQIVRGNRSIEVINAGIDKGSAVAKITSSFQADFILAAGGDLTDEEMFTVLPEHSITIKVGGYSKKSDYFLHSYNDLIRFLERISE